MKSNRRGILLLVTILAVSALLGGLYGSSVSATATGANDLQDSVKTFTRVLAIVQQNYAEPVDTDRVIYNGAIPAMLRTLDPHSNFFDPQQYALLREEQHGKYFGVGMSVAPRDNRTVVVAPFVDSPAYKAGLRPGDTILKVDDKSCDGLTTTEVANLLKGPKGTPVHISVGREGWDKPLEFTVVRDEIERPAVDYFTQIKPGIGYVRLTTFSNESADREMADALRQLNFGHLDGLILDLRDNTGGLLNQAVSIADMFLDKNQLVVSHHGRSSPERRYYAIRGNGGNGVPLVVLVNRQSASASEIVAGALQDHDRALIVGETTFGKALVQTQIPMSEDTAMLLTTAKYYTPSGRLIQRDYKGISLFDYLNNLKPPKTREVKLTDSGRQVYGGDGITPDVVMPAPKLNPFQTLLLRRNILYPFKDGVGDFTQHFLGERPTITRDWTVSDDVIQKFRTFLDKQGVHYTDADIQGNLTFIKEHIRREVFSSVFGLNDGYRVELQDDPQVQKAEELIPQAKALYENAKRIVAERNGTPPGQN